MRIHARVGVRPNGKAITACGQQVRDREASSDWREVTCESKGCTSRAEEWMEQFKKVKSVKW